MTAYEGVEIKKLPDGPTTQFVEDQIGVKGHPRYLSRSKRAEEERRAGIISNLLGKEPSKASARRAVQTGQTLKRPPEPTAKDTAQ